MFSDNNTQHSTTKNIIKEFSVHCKIVFFHNFPVLWAKFYLKCAGFALQNADSVINFWHERYKCEFTVVKIFSIKNYTWENIYIQKSVCMCWCECAHSTKCSTIMNVFYFLFLVYVKRLRTCCTYINFVHNEILFHFVGVLVQIWEHKAIYSWLPWSVIVVIFNFAYYTIRVNFFISNPTNFPLFFLFNERRALNFIFISLTDRNLFLSLHIMPLPHFFFFHLFLSSWARKSVNCHKRKKYFNIVLRNLFDIYEHVEETARF